MSKSQDKKGLLTYLSQKICGQDRHDKGRRVYRALEKALNLMLLQTKSIKVFPDLPRIFWGMIEINSIGMMTVMGYEQIAFGHRYIYQANLSTKNKVNVALAYLLRPLARMEMSQKKEILSYLRENLGSDVGSLIKELNTEPKRSSCGSIREWTQKREAWARQLSPDAQEILLWEAAALSEHMIRYAEASRASIPQLRQYLDDRGMVSLSSVLADVNPIMAQKIREVVAVIAPQQLAKQAYPTKQKYVGRERNDT